MSNERLLGAYRLFARLLGVATTAGGLVVLPSVPIVGVPLIAVGLLFALRPVTGGELLGVLSWFA